MAIIVIEGPDGTGKTTLARKFEALGWYYMHNGPPKEDENLFDVYTEEIIAAHKSGHDTVFDRLHVGELVYGEVMRGISKLSLEQLRLLNRLLFDRDGYIIFCDTSFETILQNWQKRRAVEYVTDSKKLQQIQSLYQKLRREEFSSFNSYIYDYSQTDIEQMIQEIL